MPVLFIIIAAGALALYLKTRAPVMDFGGGSPLASPDDADNSDGAEPMEIADDGPTVGDFGHPMEPSPNKGSRNGQLVTMLVWHYTAGSTAKGAISWLTNSDAKASAHFVIGRDGAVTQLVPLADAAWHSGSARLNRCSIGVEVVNVGYVTPDPDNTGGWLRADGSEWRPDAQPQQATLRFPNGLCVTQWWVPYTRAQVGAMKALQRSLAGSMWAACLSDQRGHEDIAEPFGRKTDPGPLFPWEELVPFDKRKQRLVQVA